jgi:hypothetical protein
MQRLGLLVAPIIAPIIASAVALGGCGKLFGIADIPFAGDAGTTDATDAAPTDAAPPSVAKIQIGSPSYDFGGVTIGTVSFALSIEVSNVGTGASGPLSMMRAGDGADFVVSNDGCTNASLAIGATCMFKVTFSPGAAGARASTFVVSDPGVSAETIFKGVGITAGAIAISPSPFDFGTLTVGNTSRPTSFEVKNNGNASLALLSIAITNDTTFELDVGSCGPLPRILPPNATCQVSALFIPHVGGTQTSSLTVTSDAPTDNTASASLGGTGSATVTVTQSGDGTGEVTSSDLAINCGNRCTALFTTSSVTLTATPTNGATFAGWTNCSSVNGTTCSVTTEAPSTTVDAEFSHNFTLTIELSGSQGVVTGSGINCQSGIDCAFPIPANTDVRLTPAGVGRSSFNLWTSGPCFTQNINSNPNFPDCTFRMTSNITVGADFADDATINFIPDPNSTQGSNAHIDLSAADRNGNSRCRTTDPYCTFHFARPTSLKVSAASDECAAFDHFSGGGCGNSNSCEITADSPITTINYFYVVAPGNVCVRAR